MGDESKKKVYQTRSKAKVSFGIENDPSIILSFPAFQSDLKAFIEDDSDPDIKHPGDYTLNSQELEYDTEIGDEDDTPEAPRSFNWYLPSELKEKKKKTTMLEKLKRDKEMRLHKKSQPVLVSEEIVQNTVNNKDNNDKDLEERKSYVFDIDEDDEALEYIENTLDLIDQSNYEPMHIEEENLRQSRITQHFSPITKPPSSNNTSPVKQFVNNTPSTIRIRVSVGEKNLIIPCPSNQTVEWLRIEAKQRYEKMAKVNVDIENLEMEDGFLLSPTDTIGDVLRDNDLIIGRIGSWKPHPMDEMYELMCKNNNIEVNTKIMNAFSDAKNSGKLDLSFCQLTNDHFIKIIDIIQHHKLISIDISWNSLNDYSLSTFAESILSKSNQSLKSLRLSNNMISPVIITTNFIEAIGKLNNLTELDLSSNYLGDLTGEKLSQSLSSLTLLMKLNISRCALTKETIKHLNQKKSLNLSLNYLDISENLIYKSDIKLLSSTLKSNLSQQGVMKLESLNLSYCNIFEDITHSSSGHSDDYHQFDELFNSSQLQIIRLNISHNKIPDNVFFVNVLSSIANSKYMTELDMSNCSLSPGNLSLLFELLKNNSVLKSLTINYNNLSGSSKLLSMLLEVNYNISSLSIRGCQIKDEFIHILKSLEKNRSLKSLNVMENDLHLSLNESIIDQFKLDLLLLNLENLSLSCNNLSSEVRSIFKDTWKSIRYDNSKSKKKRVVKDDRNLDIFELGVLQ